MKSIHAGITLTDTHWVDSIDAFCSSALWGSEANEEMANSIKETAGNNPATAPFAGLP